MTGNDMELVRQYAAHRSESAFSELVSRHTNLVYSAALRQARDPHLAEEITQVVFVILARKATALNAKTILPSWLYRTACFVSGSAIKQNLRRQHREQEAYMQSTLQETGSAWEQMSPLLDDAMLKLAQADRDALVLRFFEGRSLREVGAALGASEDAAKKRVNRAVEKLRQFLTKRGVILPAAVLTAAMTAHSVQAAPSLLAKTATTLALAKGATASSSSLTLIKGALKLMAWTKAKMAIVAGVSVLLVAGTATVTVEKIQEHRGSAWQLGEADYGAMMNLPPQTAILTSKAVVRARKNPHVLGSTASWDGDGRVISLDASVVDILRRAYMPYRPSTPDRIIVKAQLPKEKYDFISNLPKGAAPALQREIKKKFGLTGRFEMIETNVWLLRVKYPKAAGLKASVADEAKSDYRQSGLAVTKGNMDDLAVTLENRGFRIFVINQTGLKGNFDYDLAWKGPSVDDLNRALTDQLGLELVPDTMPLNMLIVEKAP